jgi:glycine hydroxymethyltransferase
LVDALSEIVAAVKNHEEWRGKNCLNLIPSENVMSPTVRSVLSSDLGQRYTSRDKFYMGTRLTDEIERQGEKLAEQVFGAETADLRPLSGHIADLTILALYAKPSSLIMCVSPSDGGYPGIWRKGAPSFLKLKVAELPFSKNSMNIEVEKAVELVRKKRPSMVIFGASLILFPHPVRTLTKAVREVGAHIAYDGSHVLGLIAGGEFQDPLREGAGMLFGSTHKTFFGPQGGIILADKEHGEVIKKSIFPAFVDNAHWNRIAALTLALAEMKEFGREYARQVVKNAQVLARALSECGFPVACSSLGFTKSHQVYLDYGGFGNGVRVARKLEKVNIITDCGVRLGASEMTRRGMRQAEMGKIAEFIARVVKDDEQPAKIKSEVTEFVGEFQEVRYCFR